MTDPRASMRWGDFKNTLELILAKREEEVPRDVAIRMAGPVRLKAITMTTLTTIIVIVRLAFFPDIGMDAYSPIATVILGGLLLSTLLTLVVVPVVYSFLDDGMEWLKRRDQQQQQLKRRKYAESLAEGTSQSSRIRHNGHQ